MIEISDGIESMQINAALKRHSAILKNAFFELMGNKYRLKTCGSLHCPLYVRIKLFSTRVPGAEKMSASVEVLLRKERHDHFSSYPYGKFTHKYRLKTCGSLHCPLYVKIKLFLPGFQAQKKCQNPLKYCLGRSSMKIFKLPIRKIHS